MGVAGVEAGVECWCSPMAVGQQGESSPVTACNTPCRDNPNQWCGADAHLSEFSYNCSGPPYVPPMPTPAAGQCDIVLDLGCFAELSTGGSTMSLYAGTATTHEQCGHLCYQLGAMGAAGIFNGDNCWCSADNSCKSHNDGEGNADGLLHLPEYYYLPASLLTCVRAAIGTPGSCRFCGRVAPLIHAHSAPHSALLTQ